MALFFKSFGSGASYSPLLAPPHSSSPGAGSEMGYRCAWALPWVGPLGPFVQQPIGEGPTDRVQA